MKSSTSPSADRVRVLLVDDHVVVRRGLRAFFEVIDDIEVIGEAGDGQQALDTVVAAEAAGAAPDVALVDLVMPGLDGLGLVQRLAAEHPQVRVVILTSFGETERVHTALSHGVAGYVLKHADPTEVVTAVRAAARGDVFLDPSITRRLAGRARSTTSGIASLTARERDVLTLVGRGCSNQQIAHALTISERTARSHVSSVLQKLDLASRTQAALLAVREGLVQLPEG